jgi:hypothetical protein
VNGNGHKAPDWIPAATLVRLEAVAREFVRLNMSGQVTVVLHFKQGCPMPSQLIVHEFGTAKEGLAKEGPADVFFAVRR